ncbi:uncharacterized protein LOC144180037 [Haemaphysalis longicornis]
MSRWEFRRGRLEDAKRRWGLWWRVDPFVNAIRNSASLRKLHFDTNHFLDAELTRLLQAAQDRNSFRELHFDQLMKWLCIFGRQTANDIIWKLSETLQNSYTLTSLRVDYFCPSNPQWQQVKNIVRRNSALVERAAHFVLGARTRICAAAYETVSWHPLVLRKVATLASVGEEEARQKLTEAEQALQNDFWRLSGVVKEELACENLGHGEVQIDQLGMDAWLTVRKFLNVSDIVDAKPILKQTRSQKANIKY